MPETVISFPIDDGPFKAFAALYEKFQAAVKQLPDEWEKINVPLGETSASLDHVLAGLLAQNQILTETQQIHERIAKLTENREVQNQKEREQKQEIDRQKELERQANAQASHWRDMASNSGKFAVQIKDATIWLLKWSTITSVIGGLLGGGGLFGIARLAGSTAQARQQTLGIGVPYGQLQAFGTSFGRFLGGENGAQGFLGGVQELMFDVTRQQAFAGAGINQSQWVGKNPADVGVLVLQHLRDIAIQNRSNPAFANVWQSRQLEQFMPWQQGRVLANTSQSEFNQQIEMYRRSQSSMGLADTTLKKWQELDTQLELARKQIGATFVDALTPLTSQITDLSAALVAFIRGVFGGPSNKEATEQLQKGMSAISKELRDPDFQKGVQEFVTDIIKLAAAIAGALKFFFPDPSHGKTLEVPHAGQNLPLTPEEKQLVGLVDYMHVCHPDLSMK